MNIKGRGGGERGTGSADPLNFSAKSVDLLDLACLVAHWEIRSSARIMLWIRNPHKFFGKIRIHQIYWTANVLNLLLKPRSERSFGPNPPIHIPEKKRPIYPKIIWDSCKIPKFEKIYTLCSKLVKITQFLALKYHIPNIKYPKISFTQKSWPTLHQQNIKFLKLKGPASQKQLGT